MRIKRFKAYNKHNGVMDVIDLRQSGHEVYAQYDYEGGGWYSSFIGAVDERKMRDGSKSACVLMEFIGFKDKRGEDICEGHILKIQTTFQGDFINRAVYWDEDRAMFRTSDVVLTPSVESDTEIIGNIYKNPELLTT